MPQQMSWSPRLPRAHSLRAKLIARWFDLTWPRGRRRKLLQPDWSALLPTPGQIVSINGASGSGKSMLLRQLRSLVPPGDWLDLDSIRLPNEPVIDCFGSRDLAGTLSLLARVGLSEAWTYLRKPNQLSEGQRWRLRLGVALSIAMDRPGTILVCDEFAAVLDRVTAAVVARALRRAIVGPLRAIVVTSHDDLRDALGADRMVRCDFGTIAIQHANDDGK